MIWTHLNTNYNWLYCSLLKNLLDSMWQTVQFQQKVILQAGFNYIWAYYISNQSISDGRTAWWGWKSNSTLIDWNAPYYVTLNTPAWQFILAAAQSMSGLIERSWQGKLRYRYTAAPNQSFIHFWLRLHCKVVHRKKHLEMYLFHQCLSVWHNLTILEFLKIAILVISWINNGKGTHKVKMYCMSGVCLTAPVEH